MELTDKQVNFMKTLGLEFDFDNLTQSNLIQIEDVVGEKLKKSGFNLNDNVTADGKMCESILDLLV